MPQASKIRLFPILGDEFIKAIPWAVLTPHEKQAVSNHGGQTLERLAQRGGLGTDEACAVINGISWGKIPKNGSKAYWASVLMRKVYNHEWQARKGNAL